MSSHLITINSNHPNNVLLKIKDSKVKIHEVKDICAT